MAILKSILNLLKMHRRSGKASGTGETRAVIIPREKNPIRKSDISQNAVRVLRVLNDAGYEAYLVGGGIRDLILGRHPKDFDVTTNATPEQVKRLFRNCRIIGRRFKIVHVVFAEEIIEVATFRGRGGDEDEERGKRAERNGMLVRDNLYGTLEEDADRRDFTINSVYWSAKDGSLRDFHNGLRDMREGRVDIIGDPDTRYHEDPVRMLRAVRFAAKLGMTITERTDEPIYALSHLLDEIAPARLFEEVLKLFVYGHAVRSLEELRKHHLFKELFPAVDSLLDSAEGENYQKFLNEVCSSTDRRIQGGKPVTATFMYASLMWPSFISEFNRLRKAARDSSKGGKSPAQCAEDAMNTVIGEQCRHTAIPRVITTEIRELWTLEFELLRMDREKAPKIITMRRFRSALDFMLYRGRLDERLMKVYNWWNDFYNSHLDLIPQRQPRRDSRDGGRKGGRRPRSGVKRIFGGKQGN
jgi:poly(A) polymerase